MPLAQTLRFDFAPPERIEPGFVYIPANETMGANGAVEVGGAFQISRREVTVEEYLRFWKSLPPDKRRKYRAVLHVGGDRFLLWKDDGSVNPPYTPQHPVSGIPGEAAAEYCRYLSARLGRKVSLPRLWQWRRAARGADARVYPWGGDENGAPFGILADPDRQDVAPVSEHNGDVSPFGVVNMAGNVREFALPTSSNEAALVLVLGGSYQLPLRHAKIDAIQFRQWNDRGDDIGFRCVIEGEK